MPDIAEALKYIGLLNSNMISLCELTVAPTRSVSMYEH